MNKKILKFLSIFLVLIITSISIVFAISITAKTTPKEDGNDINNPLGRDESYRRYDLNFYLNKNNDNYSLKSLLINEINANKYYSKIDKENFANNAIEIIKKCLDSTPDFYQKSNNFTYEIAYKFVSENEVKMDIVWSAKNDKNYHFFDQILIKI